MSKLKLCKKLEIKTEGVSPETDDNNRSVEASSDIKNDRGETDERLAVCMTVLLIATEAALVAQVGFAALDIIFVQVSVSYVTVVRAELVLATHYIYAKNCLFRTYDTLIYLADCGL